MRPPLAQPQSAELIDRAPLPRSWPGAWEPSGDGPWAPALPAPSLLLSAPLPRLSECQGSDIVAPHHPLKPPGLTERQEDIWYLYHRPALPIYRSLEIPQQDSAPTFPRGPQIISASPYGGTTVRLNDVTRLQRCQTVKPFCARILFRTTGRYRLPGPTLF